MQTGVAGMEILNHSMNQLSPEHFTVDRVSIICTKAQFYNSIS